MPASASAGAHQDPADALPTAGKQHDPHFRILPLFRVAFHALRFAFTALFEPHSAYMSGNNERPHYRNPKAATCEANIQDGDV